MELGVDAEEVGKDSNALRSNGKSSISVARSPARPLNLSILGQNSVQPPFGGEIWISLPPEARERADSAKRV